MLRRRPEQERGGVDFRRGGAGQRDGQERAATQPKAILQGAHEQPGSNTAHQGARGDPHRAAIHRHEK